jgi:hypothetical protein
MPALELTNAISRAQSLRAEFDEQWNLILRDVAELERQLPQRREALEQLSSRPEVDTAEIDRALFDVSGLGERYDRLVEDLDELRADFASVWGQLDRLAEADDMTEQQRQEALVNVLTGLSSRLLELGIVQARARLDAIPIEPLDLTPEQALRIAAYYRRDWANARAALVDSWRLIAFNANDLRSDLNIFFSGDIGNVGDNPFRLRSTNGRLRAGLQFDPPLTRRAERNVYRQSLIEYQQARREYYQFRDRTYQNLRNTISQIRLNELNFELRRAAVMVAIAQVDLTQLRLSEPPQPGEVSELGATTARDLVQSLSDLVNVQNDFLSVWVNNEVQLMNLEYNLGVMELDPSGQRIELGVPLTTFLAAVECHEKTEYEDPEKFPAIEFLPELPEGAEEVPAPLRMPLLLPPAGEPLRVERQRDTHVTPVSVELPLRLDERTSSPRRLPPVNGPDANLKVERS